jgi:hypothetical protein
MSHQLNTNNSSIVLHVRSEDGAQHTDGFNTDFSVYLSQPIKCRDDENFLISLSSAQIPYSFYNIQANLNSSLAVNGETISITPANYNVNTFAAEVQKKVPQLLMSYNKSFGKYVFSSTEDVTITLTALSPLSQMGLVAGDHTITPLLPISSTNVVSMFSFNSLFIKTPNLFSLNSIESRHGGYSDILSKIEIQSSPNEYIYHLASMNQHKSLIRQKTISMISFALCATSNHLINLNGLGWEFSVQFDIVKVNKESALDVLASLPRILPKSDKSAKRI